MKGCVRCCQTAYTLGSVYSDIGRTVIDVAQAPTPRWYRGLCHLHSRFSDGWTTVEGLAKKARQRDYDFMAVTDHVEAISDPHPVFWEYVFGPDSGFEPYVGACLSVSRDGEFATLPGGEFAAPWGLPNAQDESTAHILAFDLRPLKGQLDLKPRANPIADWMDAGGNAATAAAVHAMLELHHIPFAAAHQFQYSYVRASAREFLRGSDFRYDMTALCPDAGVDFYYRTTLEVSHEAEDLVLWNSLVSRCQETGALPETAPWAYTSADYHVGSPNSGLAREQFSHCTWVWLNPDETLSTDSVLRALSEGRTCASRGKSHPVMIEELWPLPGRRVHSLVVPRLQLRLALGSESSRPLFVFVFRDGVERTDFRCTYRKGLKYLDFEWEDQHPLPGLHAYVIVVAGKVVTSPILIQT